MRSAQRRAALERGILRVLASPWLPGHPIVDSSFARGISGGRVTETDARILQKDSRGSDCRPRGRGVPSGEHGRICAIDEQRELRREGVRIINVELRKQIAIPQSAAFLEMRRKVP
jgi:hypothetical protein